MGLFDAWRKRALPLKSSRVSAALVRDTSAYLLRLTNPRLALVPGFEQRLAEAVRGALDFMARCLETLPALHPIDPDNWMSAPQLASFFVSRDEMIHAFSASEPVQQYFAKNPVADSVCAVLTTRMIEREVFGVALSDGQLRNDVLQLRVSFSDPKVPIVAHSEAELRKAIGRRMIEELAMLGMERIAARQEEKRELGEARSLLLARERMLQQQGAGLGETPTAIREIETRLRENARALARLGDGADALERDLDDICTVLGEAEHRVGVERRQLRLTATNQLVRQGDPGEPVRSFEQSFALVRRGEQTRERAFLMTRFPRSALRTETLDLDAAARLL
jgi:hypothetical protein